MVDLWGGLTRDTPGLKPGQAPGAVVAFLRVRVDTIITYLPFGTFHNQSTKQATKHHVRRDRVLVRQPARAGRFSGGMRTNAAVGLTVVICGLGGLLLAAGLTTGFTALERRAIDVAGESGLVRDLDRLESDLSQWMMSLDLVLANGETHFAQDAVGQAKRLQRLLSRIDAEAINRSELTLHGMIEQEIEFVALVASGSAPANVLAQSDALLQPLVRLLDASIQEVRLDIETRRDVLHKLRRLLNVMS